MVAGKVVLFLELVPLGGFRGSRTQVGAPRETFLTLLHCT